MLDVAYYSLGTLKMVFFFFRKTAHGSAAWLKRKELKKSGLHQPKGLFLGLMEGLPVFVENAVHVLVCAPARKGKTTSFVMPALCHDIGCSRLVTDMKSELTIQTAAHIETQHKHRVIVADPARKTGRVNANYNPLQIIRDDLDIAPEDAFADARSMALQLHPDPPGGARDPFWPNGTRKLLSFCVLAVCVLRDEYEATLPSVFSILSDNEAFEALVLQAMMSDALGGELADVAANIAATWEANEKHFESFREGALQSLAAFGPSGYLAASTAACDFRFRDLKRSPTTIFMVCDPSRMDVFAPWIRVLTWAAMKELIREDNAKPVQCIFDEFTNYVLSGLPGMLTALGGYGIRCALIVQELEEIARVYSRESLATILSQCDVKQFFGLGSFDSAKLVSSMLGNASEISASYSEGAHDPAKGTLNHGVIARPLMTEDEVRRLPDDEQIVFIRNLRPARMLKAGYQEVKPWRDQVAPNPFYGGRAFKGRVKMILRGSKVKVTRAGTRKTEKRSSAFTMMGAFYGLTAIIPGKLLAMLILCTIIVQLFGWPHLRTVYGWSGRWHAGYFTWCRYDGPPLVTESFEIGPGEDCPVIIWRK